MGKLIDGDDVLRKWVKEQRSDPLQAFPGHGQMKPESAKLDRLRKEVQKLRAGHPKKSCGLLRQGIDVKFGFVTRHRGAWTVRQLCEALWAAAGFVDTTLS